jgi:SAM-dependent methyltransferase
MIDLALLLRCPTCTGVLGASLSCSRCGLRYPVVDGIPRFVPTDNYAASFGLQWNRFARTQLDSHTGSGLSRRRFLDQSGWTATDLRGALVLDAGCGSGRFAEIALDLGAEVVAIDYSSAVDACARNLAAYVGLHVIQADIYSLPFAPESFDFVYSFGVIQHTPDVRRTVASLVRQMKPGGRIAIDAYRKGWHQLLHPKFWLRPFTRRIPPEQLLSWVERLGPPLLSVSRAAAGIPLLGPVARRAIPVANYDGVHPLSEQALRDFAILDTFDWLSARFDKPQTARTLERWLRELGLVDVEVLHPAHLTARARKAERSSSGVR